MSRLHKVYEIASGLFRQKLWFHTLYTHISVETLECVCFVGTISDARKTCWLFGFLFDLYEGTRVNNTSTTFIDPCTCSCPCYKPFIFKFPRFIRDFRMECLYTYTKCKCWFWNSKQYGEPPIQKICYIGDVCSQRISVGSIETYVIMRVHHNRFERGRRRRYLKDFNLIDPWGL